MGNAVRQILLVEDNQDDEDLARLALGRTGIPHTLVTFSRGEAAVDYLYSEAVLTHPPALILLDLSLPGMDGKAILRHIRGNPQSTRIPVVVLTSSSLEQDRVDAYCLGANSYFVKPVDLESFVRDMLVLTTYWLGLNISPPGFRAAWSLEQLSIAAAAIRPGARPRLPNEVVIVDARQDDLRRTTEALESLPVRTRHLRGFQEVMRFMRDAGGPPPLLDPTFPRLFLVDVELDQGDGRDVLQALRYRTDHNAIVVMLTRHAEPEFVSECYRVKVSGVVRKPDEPVAYRDAVRLLAYYWMYINEPPPDPSWSKKAMAHPG